MKWFRPSFVVMLVCLFALPHCKKEEMTTDTAATDTAMVTATSATPR